MRLLLFSMVLMFCGGCGSRRTTTVPSSTADAGTSVQDVGTTDVGTTDAGCKTGLTESTIALCSDGCDNDGTIYFDCGDIKCCGIRDCPPSTYCGRRIDGNSFTAPINLDDQMVAGIDPVILPAGLNPCHESVLATVVSVADGDTIYVSGFGTEFESVRIIGVNTPEVAHDPTPAECYGDEAAAFTDQLDGHHVWLTFDSVCRDHYGRVLAYVHIGAGKNDMLQRQLLRRGFGRAFAFGDTRTFSSLFAADETIARDGNTGLWSACP